MLPHDWAGAMSDLIKDIRDGIRSDPRRFLFSVSSIMVGLLSLIVLTTVSRGLNRQAEEIIHGLDVNAFGVFTRSGENGRSGRPLITDDRDMLRENLDRAIVAGFRSYQVETPGSEQSVNVVAADIELPAIRGWRVVAGRHLDRADMLGRERLSLISRALSERWGWGVDSIIMLGRVTFRVVGVVDTGYNRRVDAEPTGAHLFGESVVFVPLGQTAYWSREPDFDPARLDGLFVRMPDTAGYQRGLALSHSLLSHPRSDAPAAYWITPDELVAGTRELQNTLRFTLGFIVVLSLTLGMTTLVGMMTASVRVRTQEIGLRRALGADDWSIRGLFVFEAVVVTSSAYAIAYAIALLLNFLYGSLLPVELVFDVRASLIPLGIALVSGVCASLVPAEMARRIEPAIALRH
jgi:putative ABC transport system permease protein